MKMKISFKFIYFQKSIDCWFCYNKKSDAILGQVGYYPKWKQNIFVPASDKCAFSSDCLIDIAAFLDQVNTKAKLEQLNELETNVS
jgi:hypothetical protein